MGKHRTKSVDWEKASSVAPTYDWLAELDFGVEDDLEKVVNYFVKDLSKELYHFWEGIFRIEQNLPPVVKDGFEYDPYGAEFEYVINEYAKVPHVLSADGVERPAQPWYAMLEQIANGLLLESFETTAELWKVRVTGWPRLADAVEQHAEGLSLPNGAQDVTEAVPTKLRDRLWVQTCFEPLIGLGAGVKIGGKNGRKRLERFAEKLKEQKESVKRLELSVEKLAEIVRVPAKDREIFVRELMGVFGVKTPKNVVF